MRRFEEECRVRESEARRIEEAACQAIDRGIVRSLDDMRTFLVGWRRMRELTVATAEHQAEGAQTMPTHDLHHVPGDAYEACRSIKEMAEAYEKRIADLDQEIAEMRQERDEAKQLAEEATTKAETLAEQVEDLIEQVAQLTPKSPSEPNPDQAVLAGMGG